MQKEGFLTLRLVNVEKHSFTITVLIISGSVINICGVRASYKLEIKDKKTTQSLLTVCMFDKISISIYSIIQLNYISEENNLLSTNKYSSWVVIVVFF